MTKTLKKPTSPSAAATPSYSSMELVCGADSMASLRAAVENGADSIRLGYRIIEGAPSLKNLQLDHSGFARAIRYAHDNGSKVALSLEAAAIPAEWSQSREVIERAAHWGIDAITVNDAALMLYCLARYPRLPLHYEIPEDCLSGDVIGILQERFGITRILLPRALSLAGLEQISKRIDVELEVCASGHLCSIVRGNNGDSRMTADSRTGISLGCDTEARFVAVERCAAIEAASNDSSYQAEDRAESKTLALLPRLRASGVHAIQIGAQHRGAIQTAQLTRVWREALDSYAEDPEHFSVKPSWLAQIDKFAGARKAR